jgi:hypothetical protein
LISALSLSDWPRWIGYLLEALDTVAGQREQHDDFDEMLTALSEALTRRVELGHW